jgi:predicted kinase
VLGAAGRGGTVEIVPGTVADAVDYAVELRRFDEHQTLAAHLLDGRVDGACIDRVARRIAAFHRDAVVCAGAGAARFVARVHADLDDLGEPQEGTMRGFARAALRRREAELDGRARDGLVRDGHGDLRAEHVLLTDPLLIVDRLEFDPGLRACDVGSDLAFLAMDLERLGAPWAARRLVDAYREAGGSPASAELQALFAWQRALVRMKVARLSADDAGWTEHATLAGALAWRARLPPVVLVAGPPASGKSTVAAELARLTGRPVVSTDVVRKALNHVPATERLGPEAYTDAATLAVYEAVGHRAADACRRGDGVIVDATARTPLLRRHLLAPLRGLEAPVVMVCAAPTDVLVRRARERVGTAAVSDAGPAVAEALAASFVAPRAGEPGLGPVVEVATRSADPLADAARQLDADAD